MEQAWQQLLAFVDHKDPFMPAAIAEEELPGPILSILGARAFDRVHLFHTPQLAQAADSTEAAIRIRWPQCRVEHHELPVSDPKDYSSVMGTLARQVRQIARDSAGAENFVCVSSGTAEMRAAWFLLAASGVLPATLLQVGSPAEPLFGAGNVKEVRLDRADWSSLRDLVMPQQYFLASEAEDQARYSRAFSAASAPTAPRQVTPQAYPGLEDALQKLGIFVGSAVLREAAERAAIAAGSELPVLLLGETGTGKDLFARLVHDLSERREQPLIAVNCAAIPKELVESHLFGHVKGAFTGAAMDQKGKFEQADRGTLFLDEIGELPLDAQAKILRVVQDGRVEPVGSQKPRKVDVRIVAATNRDLRQEIAAGRFREDLFYRLEVVQIRLPALRERPGEIASLAAALLKRINMRRSRPRQLSKDALRRLEQYAWPGNVRELSNVLERSVLYARSDVLEPGELLIASGPRGADPLATLPEPAPGFSLESFLLQARKQLIIRALEKCRGNQSGAAELLGLTKQAVSKFLKGQLDNRG
jgi:transcriptional regulator with GAF, ATPase, and Fis domain